jgi:hypothetical protein
VDTHPAGPGARYSDGSDCGQAGTPPRTVLKGEILIRGNAPAAPMREDGLIRIEYTAVIAEEDSRVLHLPKSRMASSARTPPMIVIGTNGAFAAISALEIMI